MNSIPPQTAAPAAEPSGQSARGRVADYDRLVDDLAYTYEGIFSRDSIAQAVADARQALEPTATIPDFLPILVSRFARERLTAAAQADGRLIKPVPELLFVCVQNAGRSQMAAALADAEAEPHADAAPYRHDEDRAGIVRLQRMAAGAGEADDGDPEADRHHGRGRELVEGRFAQFDAEECHDGRRG